LPMYTTLKKLLFQIIYRTYLWSSKGNTEFGLSERIVEYPFVVRNLQEDLPSGKKILVVGCAGDVITTILCALNYKTWGLDIKFVPLKYPNFQFLQGDIRHTNFQDGFFDAIVAVSTIEHVGIIDGDRHGDLKAIKEMIRILAKGGVMLITVPYSKEKTVDSFQRVYDDREIKNLLKGFSIEKKFEFYKQDNKGYWMQTSPKNSHSGSDLDSVVALLKLKLLKSSG